MGAFGTSKKYISLTYSNLIFQQMKLGKKNHYSFIYRNDEIIKLFAAVKEPLSKYQCVDRFSQKFVTKYPMLIRSKKNFTRISLASSINGGGLLDSLFGSPESNLRFGSSPGTPEGSALALQRLTAPSEKSASDRHLDSDYLILPGDHSYIIRSVKRLACDFLLSHPLSALASVKFF